MQLTVRPEDLHAAAVALAASAARLDEGARRFTATARYDAPELGRGAAAAAEEGATAAGAAVQVVVDDLRQLSRALQALAALYQRLDRTAVPR